MVVNDTVVIAGMIFIFYSMLFVLIILSYHVALYYFIDLFPAILKDDIIVVVMMMVFVVVLVVATEATATATTVAVAVVDDDDTVILIEIEVDHC